MSAEEDYDEQQQLRDEEEADDEEKEQFPEDEFPFKEIYYIEVVGKEQKDTQGPISYTEFKRRYQDESYGKLTYMSPMRDALEMPEWQQLWKVDKIFKDLDPDRYQELKSKASKADKPGNDDTNAASAPSAAGLAKPMSIQEMKDKERKEEEQRLKNADNQQSDRPILEEDAKYDSGSCCTIL